MKVIILILFSLLCNSTILNCQLFQEKKVEFESGEEIKLFTDRSIYCVNEKIYFTANYSCISPLDSLNWSNVLYVELINWSGNKLVQLKLKLNKSGSSGCFEIPENIPSGNYYLRAYTKWMRNFSATNYGYLILKIVNPFKADIETGPTEISINKDSLPNKLNQNHIINSISCSTHKKTYKTREKVDIELNISDEKFSESNKYCVSIAKVGTQDTLYSLVEPLGAEIKKQNNDNPKILLSKQEEDQFKKIMPDIISSFYRSDADFKIEYLPEIRGISVSGIVATKSDHSPAENVVVSLSDPVNGEYIAVYPTKKQGRFIFTLPDLQSEHNFFIGATKDTLCEILIDNDFCNNYVSLPYIPFHLTEKEKKLVKDIVINTQLNIKFSSVADTVKSTQVKTTETNVFYGKEFKSYYTKDYIELLNLEEFFIEIVHETYIKHNKNKGSFKNARITTFSYLKPLILLDNVYVTNEDDLLKIPLSKIEKVDVIDRGYIVGNMKYNGVVSIYSKNKDFAGIKLKNTMSFNYKLFSEETQSFPVSNKSLNNENKRIPDRRNLLYWNPDIQLTPGKKTIISFYTSDERGDYIVYVRLKNGKDDNEIYGKCFFSVN